VHLRVIHGPEAVELQVFQVPAKWPQDTSDLSASLGLVYHHSTSSFQHVCHTGDSDHITHISTFISYFILFYFILFICAISTFIMTILLQVEGTCLVTKEVKCFQEGMRSAAA
jgi:hypothetical protein